MMGQNPTKEKKEGAGGKPLRDNDSEEIKKGKRRRETNIKENKR